MTTNIEDIEFTLTTECTCESYDEETDTSSPSEYCYGDCWTESLQAFDAVVVQPWYDRNNMDGESDIRIYGRGMGWQRRSGEADTTAEKLLWALRLEGGYRLVFTLKSRALSIVRYSHDEPVGASFEVQVG